MTTGVVQGMTPIRARGRGLFRPLREVAVEGLKPLASDGFNVFADLAKTYVSADAMVVGKTGIHLLYTWSPSVWLTDIKDLLRGRGSLNGTVGRARRETTEVGNRLRLHQKVPVRSLICAKGADHGFHVGGVRVVSPAAVAHAVRESPVVLTSDQVTALTAIAWTGLRRG